MEEYIVDGSVAGCRLDAFLAAVTDLSRSAAVRLIEDGCVTVNADSKLGKSLRKEGCICVDYVAKQKLCANAKYLGTLYYIFAHSYVLR